MTYDEEFFDGLIEARKYKNLPQCQKCPNMIIPYLNRVDRRNRKIPLEECVCTCSLNRQRGPLEGMYGECCPSKCNNGKRYYVF